MPVESAIDLASLFEEDEFAEGATYQSPVPGTAPVTCAVIVDRGQGRTVFSGGEQQLATSERMLWAQADELAVIARDGVFTLVAGEALRVDGLPRLDQTGKVWSVQLVLEG